MKTLYFKSVVDAEDFAKQLGQYFESSNTITDDGEDFCFRVYDEKLKCTHKLVVSETMYQVASNNERGE